MNYKDLNELNRDLSKTGVFYTESYNLVTGADGKLSLQKGYCMTLPKHMKSLAKKLRGKNGRPLTVQEVAKKLNIPKE